MSLFVSTIDGRGQYKPGEIVLVNFPFTDLVSSKVRPAIIIKVIGEDVIILGIFSKIPDKV